MKFTFFWDNLDCEGELSLYFLPITDPLSTLQLLGEHWLLLILPIEYSQYSKGFSWRFIVLWILPFCRPLPKAMS